MSGFSFVADTNFLINVHQGNELVEPFLDGSVIVSVISEIELLGWYQLIDEEKKKLRELPDDCIVFELTADIRKLQSACLFPENLRRFQIFVSLYSVVSTLFLQSFIKQF